MEGTVGVRALVFFVMVLVARRREPYVPCATPYPCTFAPSECVCF